MSDQFSTIVIVGATSGLGEGFVRRFHAQGKQVIAIGRRLERLESLQNELSGLHIKQMDVQDIASLEGHVSDLITAFPHIDAVMTMAGIQSSFDFKNPGSSSSSSIASEVTTNVTAPMVLARYFVPHLLALKRSATFILVSSGLAFVPLPVYPVYCPTKAAIHYFAIMLRAQLADTSVRVVELAPPYVDTELDVGHREDVIVAQGGPEKAYKPMLLEEYLDESMEGLKQADKMEVANAFAQMGLDAWRGAFGPILPKFGVNA